MMHRDRVGKASKSLELVGEKKLVCLNALQCINYIPHPPLVFPMMYFWIVGNITLMSFPGIPRTWRLCLPFSHMYLFFQFGFYLQGTLYFMSSV